MNFLNEHDFNNSFTSPRRFFFLFILYVSFSSSSFPCASLSYTLHCLTHCLYYTLSYSLWLYTSTNRWCIHIPTPTHILHIAYVQVFWCNIFGFIECSTICTCGCFKIPYSLSASIAQRRYTVIYVNAVRCVRNTLHIIERIKLPSYVTW